MHARRRCDVRFGSSSNSRHQKAHLVLVQGDVLGRGTWPHAEDGLDARLAFLLPTPFAAGRARLIECEVADDPEEIAERLLDDPFRGGRIEAQPRLLHEIFRLRAGAYEARGVVHQRAAMLNEKSGRIGGRCHGSKKILEKGGT